jgi:uncharacterized protein YbgA (DUF1722 family)/uncharacterized protein YbbK (DUF523 family)
MYCLKTSRPHKVEPIKIGVSACLLGERVRFDGGHKRDAFLVDTLGRFVQWVPVCPEVELGLGVPRPSLKLVRRGGGVRLVQAQSDDSDRSGPSADHTEAMLAYARRRVSALAREELCGYVLKKNSPSCGMEHVKIYGRSGVPSRDGRGLFAKVLIRAYPNLPVEEEGRLEDPRLRETFIERVFAYRRLRSLFGNSWTVGDLVVFHTAHKLQLLSHSRRAYESLSRLVAAAKRTPRANLRERYEREFMAALRHPATAARHANVLQHIAGSFEEKLDEASRRELQGRIADYRAGLAPLVVPITLVRHYVRRFDITWLKQQVYLDNPPARPGNIFIRSGYAPAMSRGANKR